MLSMSYYIYIYCQNNEVSFFNLWNNLIPLHLKMTHQSSGWLGSHVLNSQNKYEAGHNQEMPVVLPGYQIHAFPSEQHGCAVNPTSIFYITEDTAHVLCPGSSSCFFNSFYYPVMNLINWHVIKCNCAHPLNKHTQTCEHTCWHLAINSSK